MFPLGRGSVRCRALGAPSQPLPLSLQEDGLPRRPVLQGEMAEGSTEGLRPRVFHRGLWVTQEQEERVESTEERKCFLPHATLQKPSSLFQSFGNVCICKNNISSRSGSAPPPPRRTRDTRGTLKKRGRLRRLEWTGLDAATCWRPCGGRLSGPSDAPQTP